MEDFVLEKVLKNDDRQKIEVIYNPKTNQRFIKRSVNDDIRYIYKMLQKINNNHIPKIYDVELTDKTVVIEEFVQGITLNEFMENHFEFAKGQINSIAKQLVSAMEALHIRIRCNNRTAYEIFGRERQTFRDCSKMQTS